MPVETPQAPSAPAAPAAPAKGDLPIPEISSAPAGAQSVKPAPAGTIPGPLKPYSDRPESAKSKMLERMRSRSKQSGAPEGSKTTDKPTQKKEVPTVPDEPETPPEEGEEDLMGDGKPSGKSPEEEQKPKEGAEPKEGEEPNANKSKAKVNPWKLADEHKARAAKAEAEIVELRRLVPNAEARKAEIAEIESIKKQNKELLEHIRYVDYTKSPEYAEKYEKPYTDQWVKSMKELDGVVVTDESGMDTRPITANDLLQVVNAPSSAKARQIANELFGEFSEDVMKQRDKIRDRYEAKQEALAKAKEEGALRGETMQKQSSEQMQKLSAEVKEVYEKAVASFTNDPKLAEFFKPIDGDEEANTMLEKGYELVDKAFSANPMNPELTDKERASIVKLHAAVRHRSAGFSRARHLLRKERAAHEATRKKLAQYEDTVPNRGGYTPPGEATTTTGSRMEAMKARLRKLGRSQP